MMMFPNSILDGTTVIGLTMLEALMVTSDFRVQHPQAKLEVVELLDDCAVRITARLPGTIHSVHITGEIISGY